MMMVTLRVDIYGGGWSSIYWVSIAGVPVAKGKDVCRSSVYTSNWVSALQSHDPWFGRRGIEEIICNLS